MLKELFAKRRDIGHGFSITVLGLNAPAHDDWLVQNRKGGAYYNTTRFLFCASLEEYT